MSRLAAACAALLLATPLAAHAQAKPDAAPTKDQHTRGMKEAPALIQAAGVPCTVTDAIYKGSGKGADGKAVDVYETTCREGMGYLVIRAAGAPKPTAFDCLAAQAGGNTCVLPANANPAQSLAPLVTAAGRTCTISNARYIGASTASGENFYEVACSSGPGFRLGVPTGAGAKPEAVDCLSLEGTNNACKLTTKEQSLASLAPLVQASGRTCQVSNGRFVGASDQTHTSYYEVACSSGPGFMLAQDTATGRFKDAIDCARATGIGGGCTLTSAATSAAAASAEYAQQAAAAGFTCQISKSRYIGQDGNGRDAVELACGNRPDGALLLFGKGKPEVFDCVQATALGQKCELSSAEPIYAKYTQALVARGRNTCKVSNAAALGQTGSGGYVVETACADGKPGWVIYFAPRSTMVQDLRTCQQSANDGHPCKLPTNMTH